MTVQLQPVEAAVCITPPQILVLGSLMTISQVYDLYKKLESTLAALGF